METIGYTLLAIVALIWIFAVIGGMIVALPWGLIGLVAISGIGILFIKVLADRLESKEDDHYEKTVDK